MAASISVVIPVYNGTATVLQALRSVALQTLPANEVIIVDDGSSDDTAHIVTRYIADNRLVNWKLIQQRNGGAASARDTGIRAATGRYVALLDADDTWNAEKLQRAMVFLEPMALDIVGAHISRTGAQSAGTCTPINKRATIFKNPYFTSTVVFLREAYIEVGGFDVSQRYSEDYKLWLTFIWRGKNAGLLSSADTNYGQVGTTKRGLSTQRWRMEKNELANFVWLYKSGLISLVELVGASVFSFAKFLRRLIRGN